MCTGLEVAQRITIGQRVRAIDLHLTGVVVEVAAYSDVALVRFQNGVERWWSSVSLQPIAESDNRDRA